MHIQEALNYIEDWTKDIDYETFATNVMLLNATIRQLEIIGEASNHLSEKLTEQYSAVEWAKIIALRNLLIHQYFGVIPQMLWQIIQTDLPAFKNQVQKIFSEL